MKILLDEDCPCDICKPCDPKPLDAHYNPTTTCQNVSPETSFRSAQHTLDTSAASLSLESSINFEDLSTSKSSKSIIMSPSLQRSSRSILMSPRAIRISMDGSFSGQDLDYSTELSPPANLSENIVSPSRRRRPRLPRRFSVTKFNIDDVLHRSYGSIINPTVDEETDLNHHIDVSRSHNVQKQKEHMFGGRHESRRPRSAPLLGINTTPVSRQRPRMQRRSSVTKFNLEDALASVKKDEISRNTKKLDDSTKKTKEIESLRRGAGLKALKKSRRNFIAKLTWGLAA